MKTTATTTTQALDQTRSVFATAPGELNSVRGQLQRAEAERSAFAQRGAKHPYSERLAQLNSAIHQAEQQNATAKAQAMAKARAAIDAAPANAARLIVSEGTASARRINELLRPQRPNTAPSVTATDPHRLKNDGIPVLRMVNSKFERTDCDSVPFNTPERHSAQLLAQNEALAPLLRRQQAIKAYQDAERDVRDERAAMLKAKRPSLKARLQRFADRHLVQGRRAEILLAAAAYLGALVYIASFYIQHRAGG